MKTIDHKQLVQLITIISRITKLLQYYDTKYNTKKFDSGRPNRCSDTFFFYKLNISIFEKTLGAIFLLI